MGCLYHFLSYKETGHYRISELGKPAAYYQDLQRQQQQQKQKQKQ